MALAALSRPPGPGRDHGVGVAVLVAPVVYVAYLESITLVAFCVQTNVSGLW